MSTQILPETTSRSSPLVHHSRSSETRRGRLLLAAGEAVLYVVAAFAVTWPGIRDLGGHIIGSVDAELFTWLGWRIGRLIEAGSIFPTHIPDSVYPYGYDLRIVDGYGVYFLSGLWNLVVGPVLAYNLTILTAVLTSCWSGRHLARVLTSNRYAVVLTALAFGTVPLIGLRAFGHVHLCFTFTTALIVAEALRSALGRGPLRPIRLAVLFFLAFLCSIYYLISSAICLLLITLIASWRRRSAIRTAAKRIVIAMGITAILMSPFIVPRLQFDRAERAAVDELHLQDNDNRANTVRFSADAWSVLAPPSHGTWNLPYNEVVRRGFDTNDIEATIYPGLLLLGGLVGLVTLRSRVRAPLLGAAGALWVLALGPVALVRGQPLVTTTDGLPVWWLPFRLLSELPGFSSLRTPARLSFALPAVLAAGLAVTLTFILRRWTRTSHQAVAFALGCCLLPFNLVAPIGVVPLGAGPALDAEFRSIAERAEPGDSLIEVPFDCSGDVSSIKFQTMHHRPQLGCQGQHSAIPWYSSLGRYKRSRPLAALRCFPWLYGYAKTEFGGDVSWAPDDWARLHREFGLRYVLVDKTRLSAPFCDERRGQIEDATAALRKITEDERWALFELRAATNGETR